MKELSFQSDNDLELLAPKIRADQSLITTGTCEGRLFDVRRDDLVLVSTATATLSLKGMNGYAVGETAFVRESDGTILESVITAVDHVARTITLTAAPAGTILAGSQVFRKIGPTITLLVFNAAGADADTKDWGFRGLIADLHADIEFGMVCRAEITLDDGPDRKVIRNKLVQFVNLEE